MARLLVPVLTTLAALETPALPQPRSEKAPVVRVIRAGRSTASAFHYRSGVWVTSLHVFRRSSGSIALADGERTIRCQAVAADPKYDLAAVVCPGTAQLPAVSARHQLPSPFSEVRVKSIQTVNGTLFGRRIEQLRKHSSTRFRSCEISRGALVSATAPLAGESGAPVVVEAPDGALDVVGVWSGRYEPTPGSPASTHEGLISPGRRLPALIDAALARGGRRLRRIPAPDYYRCARGRVDHTRRAARSRRTQCFRALVANQVPPPGCRTFDARFLDRARELFRLADRLHAGRAGFLATVVLADGAFRPGAVLGSYLEDYRDIRAWHRKSVQHAKPWGAIELAVLVRGFRTVYEDIRPTGTINRRLKQLTGFAVGEIDTGQISDQRIGRAIFSKLINRRIAGTDRVTLCAIIAGATADGAARISSPGMAWSRCLADSRLSWLHVVTDAYDRLRRAGCFPAALPRSPRRASWRDSAASPRLQIALWLAIAARNGFDIDKLFSRFIDKTLERGDVGDHVVALSKYIESIEAELPGQTRAVAALRAMVPDPFAEFGQTFAGLLAHNICEVPNVQNTVGLTRPYLDALGAIEHPVCRELDRLNHQLRRAGILAEPRPLFCTRRRQVRQPTPRSPPPTRPPGPVIDPEVSAARLNAKRRDDAVAALSTAARRGIRPITEIEVSADVVAALETASEFVDEYLETRAGKVYIKRRIPVRERLVLRRLRLFPGTQIAAIGGIPIGSVVEARTALKSARSLGETIEAELVLGQSRIVRYRIAP